MQRTRIDTGSAALMSDVMKHLASSWVAQEASCLLFPTGGCSRAEIITLISWISRNEVTLTVCWSGSITPQNTNEQRHTELEVIPRLAQTWMDALGNLPPLQQRKDKRQRQTKAAQTDESEEEDEEEDEQKLGVLWDRSHLRGSTSSVTSAPLQAYADRELRAWR